MLYKTNDCALGFLRIVLTIPFTRQTQNLPPTEAHKTNIRVWWEFWYAYMIAAAEPGYVGVICWGYMH